MREEDLITRGVYPFSLRSPFDPGSGHAGMLLPFFSLENTLRPSFLAYLSSLPHCEHNGAPPVHYFSLTASCELAEIKTTKEGMEGYSHLTRVEREAPCRTDPNTQDIQSRCALCTIKSCQNWYPVELTQFVSVQIDSFFL